jgi:hypothetical protein
MTHLHTGTLAPKRKSGSDSEEAADELDNSIAYRPAPFATAYRRLDLGYATAFRIWRDSSDQPRRDRCGGRGASDDEREP